MVGANNLARELRSELEGSVKLEHKSDARFAIDCS